MPVTDQYSGTILSQNASASGSIDWRNAYASQQIYQNFFLPRNYQLGTLASEIRYPDISGFQVMVTIDQGHSSTAALDISLDRFILGSGWSNLLTGTVVGAHTDGTCWMDIMLPEPLTITADLATSEFRLGLTPRLATGAPIDQEVTVLGPSNYLVGTTGVRAQLIEGVPYPITIAGQPGFLFLQDATVTYSVQQGVSALWYVTPNPLGARGAAFQSDGTTPLIANSTASLNFKVLGLVADSGTDFLGNEYRSCVIQDSGEDSTTTNNSWMSPPQPSQFAVLSRYFDVRPAPSNPPIGQINLVPNPSMEYDAVSGTPSGWVAFDNQVTDSLTLVSDEWAASGSQSLRHTAQAIGAAGHGGVATISMPATGGAVYSASAAINVLSQPNLTQGVEAEILWYDAASNLLGSSPVSGTFAGIGFATLTINGVSALPGAAFAVVVIVANWTGGSGTLDLLVDAVQFVKAAVAPPYGDGDQPSWEWLGSAGQSASAEFLPIVPDDDTSVLDGILVDPITPNMAFNVYYSSDDSGQGSSMTESDWERKLWARVPQVYVATQRQQYVFPEPIKAKYIKVEFTNLQGQSYDPGNFQQPVIYKKFPTWVADFFIAQLETQSFVANQVGVVNNALSFAYNYYLDDLHQSPAQPSSAPPSQIPNLTSFFSQSDAQGVVDSATLNLINLVMQSFQLPTGSLLSSNPAGSSVLSQYATQTINLQTTQQTSEVPLAPRVNYSAVSSSSREPVIFEQSLPVMYFFLACRHTYKVLSAPFDFNRAYFAGTNDISFLRHNYETSTDSSLYIESGGDTFNAEINDFVLDTDGNWYCY